MPTSLGLLFAAALVVGLALGCGPVEAPIVDPSKTNLVARKGYPLRRRVCAGEREVLADTDDDGRANVRTVFFGETPACDELDMNMDGRVDVTRLYDASGQVQLEQHDFDFDGQLDQQAFYADGQLVRKELDTNFDKQVDIWIWCHGAVIVRLERDRRCDGWVDSWETYAQGQLSAVVYDDNNDGRPERWETYERGRLATVAEDADFDGQPDRPGPRRLLPRGAAMQPVSCDGSPVSQIRRVSEGGTPSLAAEPPAIPRKAAPPGQNVATGGS